MSEQAQTQSSQGSSGQSSGAQSGGQSDSSGGDGAAFDYKKALEIQGGRLESTSRSLQSIQREFGEYREKTNKDSETLGRMREVFEPKTEKGPADPVPEYERMLDYYIAQGLESEKRGQPMPLTVNLGVQLYKTMIEQHRERQDSMRAMQELKQKVGELSDPQRDINSGAYMRLDSQIKSNLDQMYGAGDENISQKRALFNAIGDQVIGYINDLQKTKPRAWDELRRSPEKLAALANQAVAQHIPPKARQIMMQEQLENTPMGTDELWQAFREAKSIKDDAQRMHIQKAIREQIVEKMYYKERGERR